MFEPVKKRDLPKTEDLYDMLMKVDSLDLPAAQIMKKRIMEDSKKLSLVFEDYAKEDQYTESPELVLKQLQEYHYILGGCIGVASALKAKIFELELIALSEVDDTKKKVAATLMDKHARGRIAGLEGLCETLEKQEKTIASKIYHQQGAVKKSF